MIIALMGTDGSAASDLAQQLALLRTYDGSRVLLMTSPHSQGARRRLPYDDIVITTDAGNNDTETLALALASVIVILVVPGDLQPRPPTALLSRVRAAISLNPGARILVSVAHGKRDLSAQEVGNILVFVAQLAPARLAEQLLLDQRGSYHTRHSALAQAGQEDEQRMCAPEVRYLYRQVFYGRQAE